MASPFYIENLSFSFKNSKPFFENLSATLRPGKLTFLFGLNGTGKSTLIRILTGKIKPGEHVSGNIKTKNSSFDLERMEEYLASSHEIIFVCQEVGNMLIPSFSVAQNLSSAQLPRYPGIERHSPPLLHREFLTHFNIPLDIPVAQLSGGQRQLTAIIMALQKQGALLLLDEPTASLDVQNTSHVFTFLKKLIQELNLCALCICHDMQAIEKFGDTKIELVAKDAVRQLVYQS